MSQAEPPATFKILTVCTGNICRSPIMERLLEVRLKERFGGLADAVSIRSAGTWGHEGAHMETFAAQCITDLGGDPKGFIARELDAPMALGAELVLTATREHRAQVVTLAPSTARRCFTLLEFSRLLEPVDVLPSAAADALPVRLRALVEAAIANRGLVRASTPADDDIEDPYGAPLRVFARCAAVIDTGLERPLALLS